MRNRGDGELGNRFDSTGIFRVKPLHLLTGRDRKEEEQEEVQTGKSNFFEDVGRSGRSIVRPKVKLKLEFNFFQSSLSILFFLSLIKTKYVLK